MRFGASSVVFINVRRALSHVLMTIEFAYSPIKSELWDNWSTAFLNLGVSGYICIVINVFLPLFLGDVLALTLLIFCIDHYFQNSTCQSTLLILALTFGFRRIGHTAKKLKHDHSQLRSICSIYCKFVVAGSIPPHITYFKECEIAAQVLYNCASFSKLWHLILLAINMLGL